MYSINENFFDEIDNEKKAYWLGFIYADGHVAQNLPWFVIVQIKDHDHIKKMCEDMEFNGPIKLPKSSGGFTNGSQHYRVSLCRKSFCEKLNKYGRNTLPMSIPNIPIEFIPHFIRGYFDGDGSIYFSKSTTTNKYGTKYSYNNLRCQIIADESFANAIRNLFASLGISSTLAKSKSDHMKYVTISGGKNLRLLHAYLYNNANIFLTRKKEIFDQVFSPRGARSLR